MEQKAAQCLSHFIDLTNQVYFSASSFHDHDRFEQDAAFVNTQYFKVELKPRYSSRCLLPMCHAGSYMTLSRYMFVGMILFILFQDR